MRNSDRSKRFLLEDQLAQALTSLPDKQPTAEMDEAVLQMFERLNETPVLEKKPFWSKPLIKLSGLVATLLAVVYFSIPTAQVAPNQLSGIIEESQKLEKEIGPYLTVELSDVAYLESFKIKREIMKLDDQLNDLYLLNASQQEKILLWQERVRKLNYLTQIYKFKTVSRI